MEKVLNLCPLKQRIVMNYNLEGLTKEKGHNYIPEKLKGAGCNQSMLIGDINKVCLITTDIVMQAVNDCELG